MRQGGRKAALPILSFPCVSLLGISVSQLISDSEQQANGMKLVADRVPSAASVSLMDLSVEAECFGAEVRFSDSEVPTVVGRLIHDMEQAEALKGTVLYAAREDFHLAEGQYFLSDALGLPVYDTREGREGKLLGTVTDISPNAASDIYTVKTPDGAEVLVPAIPVFVTEVIPGECVRMTPIDGMFEDSDSSGKEND